MLAQALPTACAKRKPRPQSASLWFVIQTKYAHPVFEIRFQVYRCMNPDSRPRGSYGVLVVPPQS